MKQAHDFIMTSHKVIKHPYIALFFFMLTALAFHQTWKRERVDVNGGN